MISNNKLLLEYGASKGYTKEEVLMYRRGLEPSWGFQMYKAERNLIEFYYNPWKFQKN